MVNDLAFVEMFLLFDFTQLLYALVIKTGKYHLSEITFFTLAGSVFLGHAVNF